MTDHTIESLQATATSLKQRWAAVEKRIKNARALVASALESDDEKELEAARREALSIKSEIDQLVAKGDDQCSDLMHFLDQL